MSLRSRLALVALGSLLCLASAQAGTVEVLLRPSDIVDSDGGDFILAVSIPSWVRSRRIDYATLELVLEGGPTERSGQPYILRIAPIESSFPPGGPYSVVPGRWATHLGVASEEDQYVKINITPLLRHWAMDSSDLYTSVSRVTADGEILAVQLRSGTLSPGVIARMRIRALSR